MWGYLTCAIRCVDIEFLGVGIIQRAVDILGYGFQGFSYYTYTGVIFILARMLAIFSIIANIFKISCIKS